MNSGQVKVYISSIGRDRHIALKLSDELQAMGISSWSDACIEVSDDWQYAIDNAIEASNGFFIVES